MSHTEVRLPYQLDVITHRDTDPSYKITLHVRSERLGRGATVTEQAEVARLNLFSDVDHIRSRLYDLFSRIEVLDEDYNRDWSDRISPEIFAQMPETTEDSVDFRVTVGILLAERIPNEDFEPDFDTEDASYNGIRKNPVSESELRKLKRFEYVVGTSYDESCVICIENFKDKEEVIETRCEHRFHSTCILKWFEENRSCPMCRLSVIDKHHGQVSSPKDV